MAKDIADRLHALAKALRKHGVLRCDDKDFEDAANEIEKLRAQVKALQKKQPK